jgi:CheY-like chemotaxis protein
MLKANFKAQIIIPVMLALTVISSFAGIGFYQSEKKSLTEELFLKGQTLVSSLSAFAINPLYTSNEEVLLIYGQKFLDQYFDINHISFYKGDNVYLTINSNSAREKISPETLQYFKAPIFSPNNELIGSVRISLSTQTIDERMATRIFEIVFMATIAITLSTILLSWLLEKTISVPIERLTHKIQMISQGRFNYKIPTDSEDEIGHLFKDINTLRIRFKRKQDSLIAALTKRKKNSVLDVHAAGSTALVVDDDEVIQLHAKKLLEKNSMDVMLASNGNEALTILNESKVDLIVLDLIMPEFSGFEVLESLRKNPELNQIPVIAVSSISDKESIVKALNGGAVDYVIKPFDNHELIARVKTHLRASFREQELEKIIAERLTSLNNI